LKTENVQLRDQLYEERLRVVELKRKIDDLEGNIRQVEEENTLLREYNGIFGVENDKLYEENKALQGELERNRQIRIPRSITNPSPTERSKKRLKSKERSPDEANDLAARVRIVSL
jgi:hypothetical protein